MGWRPVFTSWLNTLPQTLNDFHKELITDLFNRFVDSCVRTVRKAIEVRLVVISILLLYRTLWFGWMHGYQSFTLFILTMHFQSKVMLDSKLNTQFYKVLCYTLSLALMLEVSVLPSILWIFYSCFCSCHLKLPLLLYNLCYMTLTVTHTNI